MYFVPQGVKRVSGSHDCVLLRGWLDTATKWLCDEAHARVSREITDHFVATVENKVATGLARDSAEREALEALGPPRAARRALCRSNITRQEAQLLQFIQGKPVPGVANAPEMASLFGGIAFLGVCMYLLMQLGGPTKLQFLAMQFHLIATWVGARLHKSRPARPLRDTVWIVGVFQTGLGSLLLVAVTRSVLHNIHVNALGWFACDVIVIAGVLVSVWWTWRLWSKLPNPQGPLQS
jgi:hypothetical protein